MDKFVIRKRKCDTSDDTVDTKKIFTEIGTEKQTEDDLKSKQLIQVEVKTEELDAKQTDKISSDTDQKKLKWREIRGENLNCDYCVLLNKKSADELLKECEKTLQYNEGQLAKVKVFGKWHDIPRKQVAHGDEGLAYTFSNNTVPARPWIPLLEKIRDQITQVTGYDFNFVLINRYHDGNDHMGEHRDDEKDLVHGHPIASLSLGQQRDFIFKHADARGKNAKRTIDPVKIELQHGSLLMMKHPTNTYWYHALPPRKRSPNVRINMTFRKMVVKLKK